MQVWITKKLFTFHNTFFEDKNDTSVFTLLKWGLTQITKIYAEKNVKVDNVTTSLHRVFIQTLYKKVQNSRICRAFGYIKLDLGTT